MHPDKISIPLEWSHKIGEIQEGGLKKIRNANIEELRLLAKTLDLLDCASLEVNYSIEPLPSGWRVFGGIQAKITQSCVISLEPVESHITEPFNMEFRRMSSSEKEGQDEHNILSAEDIENLEDDRIDIGRIIYEILSTALDPYPRKDGAEFIWQDPQDKSISTKNNPFLVLKNLKPNN